MRGDSYICDFENIIAFAQRFRDRSSGTELAFVLSEWTAQGGLGLFAAYEVAVSMLTRPWPIRQVAGGCIIASTNTLDAINNDSEIGAALIRVNVQESAPGHKLPPDTFFTEAQAVALITWLNNHNITENEFEVVLGLGTVELDTWLQMHARWQFAQRVCEYFRLFMYPRYSVGY